MEGERRREGGRERGRQGEGGRERGREGVQCHEQREGVRRIWHSIAEGTVLASSMN